MSQGASQLTRKRGAKPESTRLYRQSTPLPTPEVAFAHPVEAQFASILDYYGIAWEYEPRTFELEWDDEGNVITAFAPDFYLKDQELYVELTTIRPKLNYIKNRKIRLMKKLYPDVNVVLLKRRDMRDLMTKYGLDEEAAQLLGTKAREVEW